MPRGGFRPGAGRPKGTSKGGLEREIRREAAAAQLSPLDYMLQVINDPTVDSERRDRVAMAAAPYVHPRKEAVGAGKKEEKEAAAKTVAKAGKFASSPPPRLVVNN